ncbi:MAG TPA: ferric reductase-like transmembrane domain-containing protein, partial [Thiolinea sp.]|nr:ferric reductase-like transmembrane domain-containing protein [Thiolinea sp.]
MPTTIQAFHDIFVQYSGVLSISVMSIAIFLATRPQWLETRLHGLDKLYRLHKWLGITLLVTATSHWLIANSVKIAVEQGNLGAEHLRPTPPASMGGLESFLFQQQGIAVGVAGLALWVISALLIIALIKKIPYRIFTKLHHWISLAYLLIAFHAIVMFKFSYWSQPLGWVMAVLLVAGIYSALVVLTRRIGKQHKVQAELTHYNYHSDLKVIEANFKLANGWQGHEAGQFAFITTSAKEGAHPFSIASAWDPKNPNLSFVAKELG